MKENTKELDSFLDREESSNWSSFWRKLLDKLPFNREQKPELSEKDLMKQAHSLIESGLTADNLKMIAELIRLHRIIENTKARKRLEGWSKRLIIAYLFVVIVLLSLSNNPYLKATHYGFEIDNTLMITILSTTTVNIIALGLMVIRGHFLFGKEREEKDLSHRSNNRNSQDSTIQST